MITVDQLAFEEAQKLKWNSDIIKQIEEIEKKCVRSLIEISFGDQSGKSYLETYKNQISELRKKLR